MCNSGIFLLQVKLGGSGVDGLSALVQTCGISVGILENSGGQNDNVRIALNQGLHVVSAQTAVDSQFALRILLIDQLTGTLYQIDCTLSPTPVILTIGLINTVCDNVQTVNIVNGLFYEAQGGYSNPVSDQPSDRAHGTS